LKTKRVRILTISETIGKIVDMGLPYTKVAPSILSSDFSKLGEEIIRLDKSSADYIHVDVMDGHFVPNMTFGPPIISAIKKYSNKPFDVHLMISEPGRYIAQYAEAGADIIGIHHEIKDDRISILKRIRSMGKKACIVINPDIEVRFLEQYLSYVDQILIMSVFPGFGGQKFIPETLLRGKEARKMIDESGFPIELEVDGGVGTQNSAQLIEAGFNILVAGSAIYNAKNFEVAIEELRSHKIGGKSNVRTDL
jgi:ribulose-phosphate 3-epimerase